MFHVLDKKSLVATIFNRFDALWISQDPFPFCYEIEQGWLPSLSYFRSLKSLSAFHVFWSANLLGTSALAAKGREDQQRLWK